MLENIHIDVSKCVACGLCLPVCPNECFALGENTARIVGTRCMSCGHCQAVCPEEAIEVTDIDTLLGIKSFSEYSDTIAPGDSDPAELLRLMRSRRSCRNYSDRGVDKDVLEDLVKIGTTAPSGTNSQLWGFKFASQRHDVLGVGELTASFYRKLNRMATNPFARLYSKCFLNDSLGRYHKRYYNVIEDALERWDTKGDDLLFHGATAAILVTTNKEASCGVEDAMLATQNILLAAHSMGLGSCLIGFVVEAAKRDGTLKKKLGMTKDENLCSVIALGYPQETYPRPAGRKKVETKYLEL